MSEPVVFCPMCDSPKILDGYCLTCRGQGLTPRLSNDEIVDWMRARGVIVAKFDSAGRLAECALGPAPESPGTESMAPKTERPASPEDEKRAAEALLFGAA